jgi:tetratricopeptide (TPR) repeat protein
MTRTLAALTMLALPIAAQEAKGTTTDPDAVFFKAFYLEKGERQNRQALELYQQFLAANPSHKYSKKAAQNAFGLYQQLGQLEEGEKFKAKYSELLKDASDAAAPQPERRAGEGRRGEGAPPQGDRPRGGQRLAQLREDLEKAKAAGDDAKAKELEEQIKQLEERMRQGGGQGPGGRGMGGGLFSDKKITDMSDEELGALKTGIERMSGMFDRMRQQGRAEQADKMEKLMKTMSEQLQAGKKEDAEKTRQEMRALMPRRGGGN